jgi:FkbM family methyltransferase
MAQGLVKKLRVFGKALLSRWIKTKRVEFQGLHVEGAFQDYGLLNELSKGRREAYMTHLFVRCLDRCDSFWDVGAHVGVYSLLAARKLKGKVLAFEPNPRTYHFLQRNVESNKLSHRILTQPLAVASKPGHLRFFCDELESDVSSLVQLEAPKSLKTLEITATSLDQLAEEAEGLPQLMKVDVEGAELDVLKGGEVFWRKVRERGGPFYLFIESNASALERAGTTPRQLHEQLTQKGFQVSMIDEERQCLVPVDDRLQSGCWNLYCELSGAAAGNRIGMQEVP